MKPKSVEDLLTEDDIAIIAEEQAPSRTEPRKVGERVSAQAWRCSCGLDMSYTERPECTCGKSIRP